MPFLFVKYKLKSPIDRSVTLEKGHYTVRANENSFLAGATDNLCKQYDPISGSAVIKLFPCSTKFILLINVKMPTIVGILTFIGMINTKSKRFKARNLFVCRFISLCEQLKFLNQLS